MANIEVFIYLLFVYLSIYLFMHFLFIYVIIYIFKYQFINLWPEVKKRHLANVGNWKIDFFLSYGIICC